MAKIKNKGTVRLTLSFREVDLLHEILRNKTAVDYENYLVEERSKGSLGWTSMRPENVWNGSTPQAKARDLEQYYLKKLMRKGELWE